MHQEFIKITKEFIDKYIELEDLKKHNNDLYELYRRQNKALFQCFETARNTLAHERVGLEYPILINPILLDALNDVLKRRNEKAINKAIRFQDMFCVRLNANLLDTLKIMQEENYSHVPVLDADDKLIGVLSENAIVSYIVNKQGIVIDKEEVREVEDFIQIDKNRNEIFEFISRDTSMMEVQNRFIKSFNNNKRLAVIYITQTGKRTEKVLGMITAWDILGKDDYNEA